MKLHQVDTPVHGNALSESRTFKIATSSKAFRILSSNLYKYKQRAIIRELSCNAVDGHMALLKAGGTPPETFDVTLPSVLDQQFIIRDYGIGLSHDDVMEMYTTYFASTKADSDDYVGALGLGSKSPFAYTDTFTITSWFGGYKRVYSAFIKDGEPNIMLLHEEQSDDHSGVEITVPVGNDINIWCDEAKRVYSSFDTYKPNFVGYNIEYNEIKFDEHGLYTVNGYHGNGLFAVMGGVVYPLPAEYWKNTMISLYSTNTATYIKFNIGELDITPSREELSLDDDTIDAIKMRVSLINRKYDDELDLLFGSAKSVRSLYITLRKFPSQVWDTMVDSRKFGDKTIAEWKKHFAGYKKPFAYKETLYLSNVSGTIRRKKFKDVGYTVLFGGNIRTTIVNDLSGSKGSETIRALYTLGKISGNPFVFDISSNTVYDASNPTNKITTGDVAKAQLKEYLRFWTDEEQDGHVLYTSKVRDSALAEVKAKGLNIVYKRQGKPQLAFKYENGVKTEIKLYADDIDELDDDLWCGLSYTDIVHIEPEYKEKTSAKGVVTKTIDYLYSYGLFGADEILHKFTRYTGKTVYVLRKNQWNRALKNDKISQLAPVMYKTISDSIKSLNAKNFMFTSAVKWINFLGEYDETRHLYNALSSVNTLSNQEIRMNEFILACVKNGYDKIKNVGADKLPTLYYDIQKEAEKFAKSKTEKFEKDNALIVAYLKSVYSINDLGVVKDIARLAVI